MSGSKQHISDLVHHCAAYGMRHLIISPGSRNAPLTRAFSEAAEISCYSVVDERSAAFVALGMASQLKAPVGVLCTSGTALLNYGPAIAEAYYLRVPLIVISADRPARLVDQQDSQTIRQNNLFDNIVKKSYSLPEEPVSVEELNQSAVTVAEAFTTALFPDFGPVHINVPLDEPLYENRLSGQPVVAPTVLAVPHSPEDDLQAAESFVTAWRNAKKKMIVCGQAMPNEVLGSILHRFSADPSVVVVAENLANVTGSDFVDRPDSVLLTKSGHERKALAPEILISFGGHLVSKHLKILLREFPATLHLRLDLEQRGINTYGNLSHELPIIPHDFFAKFGERLGLESTDQSSQYSASWQLKENCTRSADEEYSVLSELFAELPSGSIAHLGNSMSVRHVQKMPTRSDLVYHSNRGVAGIDGCLSTAVGVAMATDQLVVCCLGDLSFVYDSNGLWNRDLPPNLRVLVLNNAGGDIFRRLKGPSESSGFQEYFVAHHPVDLGKLVEAYGAVYMKSDAASFGKIIKTFLEDQGAPVVLEIKITSA